MSDFLFVFCSLINIEEAPICHWDKILAPNFLPTVHSFTLRYKLCFKCILSKPSVFTYCVCIWSFGRARSSECTLLVCFGARRARTHTHTHTRANTHTHTHTHTLQPEEQHLSCGLYFQHFIIKHVQQFSNCKDGILQQSTDDWSDSDVKFWSGRKNARRCEEKEVVLEETRL